MYDIAYISIHPHTTPLIQSDLVFTLISIHPTYK